MSPATRRAASHRSRARPAFGRSCIAAVQHEVLQKKSLILLVAILVVVCVGGVVQIAPLFWVACGLTLRILLLSLRGGANTTGNGNSR
jgi:hypothetical protein